VRANDNITDPLKMVVLGDSLTAGYGLEEQDNFPSQLERALQSKGHTISISNAGVSGDTSTGGLERLEWSLADGGYDVLAVALGANDGLRGVDPQLTRRNLEQIIIQARKLNPDVKIILLGMLAPPNLGPEYAKIFNDIYPYLSEKYDLPLYPFFLDGVVMNKNLNQSDGIHPNEKGVKTIVENMAPFFENILVNLDNGY
jgi:acyl-CoA thioesterase-1